MSDLKVEKPRRVRELTLPGSPGRVVGLELEQTRTNSNKLEQTRTPAKMRGNDRENPMNYEEWSKSNELEQTLTPDFLVAC